ncbi:MAG: DUF2505 family protein [Acidimicrobiales bacterium]
MRFELTQVFSADLERVQEGLVDPGFLVELARLPNLGRPELLSQDRSGPKLHQKVRYRFAGQLTAVVTAVVDPGRLTWIEESVLDTTTHVTRFRILPDHYPDRLACSGKFTLTAGPAPQHTMRRTEGDLRVSFPLLGHKVEEAIISGLADHAGAEAVALDRWLAGHYAADRENWP